MEAIIVSCTQEKIWDTRPSSRARTRSRIASFASLHRPFFVNVTIRSTDVVLTPRIADVKADCRGVYSFDISSATRALSW